MGTHPQDAGAAPPRVAKVRLHSVQCKVPSYVRFLGELRQLHTHYAKLPGMPKKQTFPCTADKGCKHCTAGVPYFSRWYAAALVFDPKNSDWMQWVVEVTENAWLALQAEEYLTGTEWQLTREDDDNPRSPIRAEKLGHVSPNELIDPCEVDEFLKGFYRVPFLPTAGASKLPIRQAVASVQGTLPRGYVAGKDRQPIPAKPVPRASKEAIRDAANRMRAPQPTQAPPRPSGPGDERNGHTNGHTNGSGGGR